MRPSWSPLIRFVASLLIVVLLAVGLGLGGYCVLLALRRGPAPRADSPALPPTAKPLPTPERLPPVPDLARIALAASDRLQARPGLAITVRVRNVASAWRTEGAGIGIARRDHQDGLVWLPFANAIERTGEILLPHTLADAGDYVLTIAAGRAFANHGYLTRHLLTLGNDSKKEIELDASASLITFAASGQKHAGPFRVLRPDDANWLPMDAATGGLTLGPEQPNRLWLGNGEYELRDPLVPERSQPFAVPTATPVQLSATLAPPRTDRP